MHCRTIAVVIALVVTPAWVFGQAPADLVKATLVADTAAIQPGQPFRVAVTFSVAPHWHIYWINPGDGGIPTTVDLQLPEGFSATPFSYPVPRRFEDPGGIVSFGYENEVTLLTTVTPPAKLDAPAVTIAASANWLVCEKSCVAGNAELKLSLPIGAGAPAHGDLFDRAVRQMPAPAGSSDVAAVTQSVLPGTAADAPSTYRLVIEWKADAPRDIEWFAPPTPALSFGRPSVVSQGRRTTITASVQRVRGQPLKPAELESVIGYGADNARRGLSVQVDAGPLGSGA